MVMSSSVFSSLRSTRDYPKIPLDSASSFCQARRRSAARSSDERGRPIAGVNVQIWGYLGEKKEKHEMAYHGRRDDRRQGPVALPVFPRA